MRGSREKTREAIETLLEAHANPAMACLLAPMVTLPDTDELLDQQLADWAGLMCSLRSDTATPLEVVEREAAEA